MSGNMNMTICGSNQVIAIEYWMMTAPEVFSDFCALRFIEAYAFEVEGQSEPFPKRHVTANQNPLSATLVCIGRFICESNIYRTISNSARQIVLGIQLQPRRLKWYPSGTNLSSYYVPLGPWPLNPSLIMMSIFSPIFATNSTLYIQTASDRKDPTFMSMSSGCCLMLYDVQPELSVHPSRPTPPRHLHLSGGDLRLDTATEYIQSFGARVEDLEIRQRTQGYSGCLWRKELTVEEEAFLYVSVLDPVVCGAFLSDCTQPRIKERFKKISQFVNDKEKL
ncbi:hypothetical protein F5876DRAFT_65405 [Lentinula aff. lateritia]|uniref:Uncharacterized protein n=1 Tax=Lentinula aff. lateritia TaxID=2804960 RepID=A0ACC1U1I4_9AGAR|nr:hypothetical protein F5876DRAFT_65405 [Lentinula aff. lateritia]